MATSSLQSLAQSEFQGEFLLRCNTTIRYKDDAGQRKDGSNFGRHDLLDLAEAAREAATKIRDLQKTRG